MPGELIWSAILWSILASAVAQLVGIGLMWVLGVPPRSLSREILDVQNPAAGAAFFVVALTAALFVGPLASDGFTRAESPLGAMGWIVGGLIAALLFTLIAFAIAHRVLGRRPGEGLLAWVRRELIGEQNLSLALFLGGLTVTPFIAVVYQLI